MPRTYLSFLGAGPYQPTTYFFPDSIGQAVTTPFVQEAVLKEKLIPMEPEDRIFIFTTDDAYRNNYLNRFEKPNSPLLPDQGLQHVLQQLRTDSQILHFEAKSIPNGYSEKEVWEIFQIVFDCLREGDEVYFDITTGFRSLPMLGMVLLNYAKALRKVDVKAIYYGNFEAGRAQRDIDIKEAERAGASPGELSAMKASPTQTQILDLKAFSHLQDWTFASQSFLQAGNATLLSQLIQDSQPEIGSKLLAFTDMIQTNRGHELTSTFDIGELRQDIILSRFKDMAAQFRPLLDLIEEKIRPFQESNLSNGFAAVQWCLDHNLIPQGYTFLQETIVSLVIEQVHGHQRILNTTYRQWTGGLLSGIASSEIKPHPHHRQQDVQAIADYLALYPKVIDAYRPLVGKDGLRNDISHAGFKTHAATAGELRDGLKLLYEHFRSVMLAYRLM